VRQAPRKFSGRKFVLLLRKSVLQILSITLVAFGISLSTSLAARPDTGQTGPEYRLRLYHTHTNERIDVVYGQGDHYIPSAIAQLDRFLRDHRTGTVYQLGQRVFDLLHDLTAAAGRPDTEIDIICGYRAPWSNEYLRRTTTGVAEHSLHMAGEAIDIRIWIIAYA